MNVASVSTCKQQHGAIITKGGRVIAVGINRMRNDPSMPVTDPKTQFSVHAEVAAIKACGNTDLRGATIYVARVNKCGDPMMSKPCERCQAALVKAGIRKVYYTIDSEMSL